MPGIWRGRAPVARMMLLAVSVATGLPSLVTSSLPGARELGETVEHRDLVLLHQMRDAGGELLGDGARALHDLLQVELDIVRREAELAHVVEQMVDLGGAQQRLGRDAAPVEADAAEMLGLDDRDLHFQLRGADCRDIAARAATDDHQVKFLLLSHALLLKFLLSRPPPGQDRLDDICAIRFARRHRDSW